MVHKPAAGGLRLTYPRIAEVEMRSVKQRCLAAGVLTCALIAWDSTATLLAQDDDVIQLIVGLLSDSDKDIRALAFEQVRGEAPGEAATKTFAELLPELPLDAQAGLLGALTDRGDTVAAPAVRDLLANGQNEEVRIAAIKALGPLGDAADLPSLIQFMSAGTAAEKAAARRSLVVLPGSEASAAMAEQLTSASVSVRVMLLEILTTRRARNTIPAMLDAAVGNDAEIRRAAMVALGQLAEPEHISGMVQAVLKAQQGSERQAAEKAVMLACHRLPRQKAGPLLDAMASLSMSDRTILLSALGRVGGPAALEVVEKAVSDANPEQHEAGLRALCHWPDASIAFRLLELARIDPNARYREMALRALIRVAPLPDERSDQLRLDLLRTAMAMCQKDSDRLQVLDRAKAVRTVQTLRFVQTFMDQPTYAEQVCLTVVELAHHSQLREANKAEFHPALDKVIQMSKDASVIDRAQRYKKGQTWVRP